MYLKMLAVTASLSLILEFDTFCRIIIDIIRDKRKINLNNIKMGYAISGKRIFIRELIAYSIPFLNLFLAFSKRKDYISGKKKFDNMFDFFKKTNEKIIKGEMKLYPLDVNSIKINLGYDLFSLSDNDYSVSYKDNSGGRIYYFTMINEVPTVTNFSKFNPFYSPVYDSAKLREILKRIALHIGNMNIDDFYDNIRRNGVVISFDLLPEDKEGNAYGSKEDGDFDNNSKYLESFRENIFNSYQNIPNKGKKRVLVRKREEKNRP